MSKKSAEKAEKHAHGHRSSSSNRVLRTVTFVLTPFLILVITFAICFLALVKPFTAVKPYLNYIFNTTSTTRSTEYGGSLNIYRADDAPLNVKEVEDDDTGETHTMIYPYYGDFYATLNDESAGLVDVPVYSGTSNEVLAQGAGWYNGSVYIGNYGNVVIAGHNHTYFYNLPNCEEGDIVTLETDYVKLTYVVSEKVVFHEDDTTYVFPMDDDRLTMYTCWNNGKLGMSEYRLAVICELTEREWKEVEQ
ncbi:MAG: class D sortase [Ruminococcus sp.]|nr:class D sortase [Ruminococcus sp.]